MPRKGYKHTKPVMRPSDIFGRTIRRAEGRWLAKMLMEALKIGRVDLQSSNFPEHVEKRVIIMQALEAFGLLKAEIGAAIGRNPSTIVHWLKPGRRARSLKRMREKNRGWRKQKAEREACRAYLEGLRESEAA